MAKRIKIERTDDPSRADWVPVFDGGHYQLVDRAIPYPARNETESATFVTSLDMAAHLIKYHDHGIRMGPPGKLSGDYTYAKNLLITWS